VRLHFLMSTKPRAYGTHFLLSSLNALFQVFWDDFERGNVDLYLYGMSDAIPLNETVMRSLQWRVDRGHLHMGTVDRKQVVDFPMNEKPEVQLFLHVWLHAFGPYGVAM